MIAIEAPFHKGGLRLR